MKSFSEFALLIEKEENKDKPFNQRRKEVPGGEAAKDAAAGFSDVKPRGLETRLVPPEVTQARQQRAQRAGNVDPWTDPRKGDRLFDYQLGQVEKLSAKNAAVDAMSKPTSKDLDNFLGQITGSRARGAEVLDAALKTGNKPVAPSPESQSSTRQPSVSAPEWEATPSSEVPRGRPRPPRVDQTEPFGDAGFEAPSGRPQPPKEKPVQSNTNRSGYSPENKPRPGSEIVRSGSQVTPPGGSRLSVSGATDPYNYNPTSGSLSLPGPNKPVDATIDPVSVTDITRKPKPEISPAKPETRMVTGRVGQSRTFRGSAASSNKPQVPVATQITQALDAVDAANKTKAISRAKGAGIAANVLGAVPAAYDAYIRQKEKGASDERSLGAAVVAPAAASLFSLGAGAGALKAGGGPRGAIAAGSAAYIPGASAGNVGYDALLGPTTQQRRQAAATNRQSQVPQQVSTKPFSSRPTQSIGIDPRTGLETPVYLAKKGDQSAYFAPDTSMRGRANTTSSVPERLGRLFAMSGLPGSENVRRGYEANDKRLGSNRLRQIRANQGRYESYNVGKKSFTTFCEQSWPLLGQGDLMKGARPIVRNVIGRGIPTLSGVGGGGIYNLLNKKGRQGALSYQAKSAVATPVIQSVASKVKDKFFKDDPIRQQGVDAIAQGLQVGAPLLPTPGFIKKPIVQATQKYGPKVVQAVSQHGPKLASTFARNLFVRGPQLGASAVSTILAGSRLK